MSTITTQLIYTTQQPSEAEIRTLAFEVYKKEGGGDPVKHWLMAEAILKHHYAQALVPPANVSPSPSATRRSAQSPRTRRAGRF